MAIRLGLAPSEFWQLTPYQTQLILNQQPEMRRDESNMLLFGAWQTARLQRGKKLPNLKTILIREPLKGLDRTTKINNFKTFFSGIKMKTDKGKNDG